MTLAQRASAQIDSIEREMQAQGLWQKEPLPAEALRFERAFGADTLTFYQWLQFVLVPRVRGLVAEGGAFPRTSEVAAYAVRELDGDDRAAGLLPLLADFDALFEGTPDTESPLGDARAAYARYLDAMLRGDEEAAKALLTRSSLEGGELSLSGGIVDGSYDIGTPSREGAEVLIPSTLRDGENTQEMTAVLVQEDGAWKVDLRATMFRTIGFDPEAMVEGLGNAMAETLGGAMGQLGESLAAGMGALAGGVAPIARTPDGPSDAMRAAIEEYEAGDLARDAEKIAEALGLEVEIAIDWESVGDRPEWVRKVNFQGVAQARSALCLLRNEKTARVAVAGELRRIVVRNVASESARSCTLAGGELELRLWLGGVPTGFSSSEIQQCLRDALDLEVGPLVASLRDGSVPALEKELRQRLRFGVRVEVDWDSFLRLPSVRDRLAALRSLESDHLRHLGYLLREANEKVPLQGKLATVRYEHADDPSERDLRADGDVLTLRMHLVGKGGAYGVSDLERQLPAVAASLGRFGDVPALDPAETARWRFPDWVKDYRERCVPVETAWLGELVQRPIGIEVDWTGLAGDLAAARNLRKHGLRRLTAAVALLVRKEGSKETLAEAVGEVRLRFVASPEAKRCRIADGALSLDLCVAAGEAGTFTESELATRLENELGIPLRPHLDDLRRRAATWEKRLRDEHLPGIRIEVDWRTFFSHADMDRNLFGVHLLREHGIDAGYYALSGLAERDDAFAARARRRVRVLRLEHATEPGRREIVAEGNTLVYRLFVHEGYDGYLTIEEIEERVPRLVDRMREIEGFPEPEPALRAEAPDDDARAEARDEPRDDDDEPSDASAESFRQVLQVAQEQILPQLGATLQAYLGRLVEVDLDVPSLRSDPEALMEVAQIGFGAAVQALAPIAMDPVGKVRLAQSLSRVQLRRAAPGAPPSAALDDGVLRIVVVCEGGTTAGPDPEALHARIVARISGEPPAGPASRGASKEPAPKKPAAKKGPAPKAPASPKSAAAKGSAAKKTTAKKPAARKASSPRTAAKKPPSAGRTKPKNTKPKKK